MYGDSYARQSQYDAMMQAQLSQLGSLSGLGASTSSIRAELEEVKRRNEQIERERKFRDKIDKVRKVLEEFADFRKQGESWNYRQTETIRQKMYTDYDVVNFEEWHDEEVWTADIRDEYSGRIERIRVSWHTYRVQGVDWSKEETERQNKVENEKKRQNKNLHKVFKKRRVR